VEETTAAITAEQEREETANSLLQGDKSATFETSNQSSSAENMERSQDLSDDRSEDLGNRAARSGQDVPLMPPNCQASSLPAFDNSRFDALKASPNFASASAFAISRAPTYRFRFFSTKCFYSSPP
jgi:hypothetical protein